MLQESWTTIVAFPELSLDSSTSHWSQPLVTGLAAIIGSVSLVLLQSWYRWASWRKERRVLLYLLHDEIELRWKQFINPALEKIESLPPVDLIKKLALIRLREGDLIVMQQVTNHFVGKNLLKDNRLVSMIVHAHVAYLDLMDAQANAMRRAATTTPSPMEKSVEELSQDFSQLRAIVHKRLISILEYLRKYKVCTCAGGD